MEVGPEAAKRMMEAAYKRWPDLHVTVEDILADGDKVMVRNSWTATEAATGQKDRTPWIRLMAFCKQEDRGALGDHHASKAVGV